MAFQSCGVRTLAEQATADGFIDLVLELSSVFYIIEIKFNRSAKSAVKQIEDKKSYELFLQKGKAIRFLGLGFTRTAQKGKSSQFTLAAESRRYEAKDL
jgi:hypothetical protein